MRFARRGRDELRARGQQPGDEEELPARLHRHPEAPGEPEHQQRLDDEAAAEGVEAEQRRQPQHQPPRAWPAARRLPAAAGASEGSARYTPRQRQAHAGVEHEADALAVQGGEPGPLGEGDHQRAADSAPAAPAQRPQHVVPGEALRPRRRASPTRESRACSVGRKTLTSPAEGLSVPTKATTSSGQNVCQPGEGHTGEHHRPGRDQQHRARGEAVPHARPGRW